MQPELQVRKILGRTYLNENRLAEALDVFSKILADYPDDLETLLILGNFYLASGDGKTAKSIYARALQLDPQNKSVERQIALAMEVESDRSAEPSPTDLPAVARLLQRLTGRTREIDESDILRAAQLLNKIVNSESPADAVAASLDELDELLPALIELNIRQAYADGRLDLVEALRSLQGNIDYQLAAGEKLNPDLEDDRLEVTGFNGKILMLFPDIEKKSNRMSLLKGSLDSFGCQVSERTEYLPGRDPLPDIAITGNPHVHPSLLNSLLALSDAGVPIILDLDTDFELQPVSHHEYNSKGLGTQMRSNAYSAALSLADVVTAPSEVQAASLKGMARQVCVIPDGWSRQNQLWKKEPPSHNTINIGWVGASGQLEDLVSIRRFIVRITREFENTRIVIVGNPQAYRLFDSLSENRRLYLPVVAPEEFPYLLSQLDILLVPLRNSPYNQSIPDSILMQAGVRMIPWIASSTPAFRHWSAGGILCENLDEWHLNLRHLVMDEELRHSLGQAGKDAARSREMEYLGKIWLETIRQVNDTRAGLSQNLNLSAALSITEH